MCCVIKLQLNLNQSVIRFNRPTNTESSAAPTHYIYSTYTQYTCLLKYCRPPLLVYQCLVKTCCNERHVYCRCIFISSTVLMSLLIQMYIVSMFSSCISYYHLPQSLTIWSLEYRKVYIMFCKSET